MWEPMQIYNVRVCTHTFVHIHLHVSCVPHELQDDQLQYLPNVDAV